MKRDRSNLSSCSSLGLPRRSILRGRKNFDRLFNDATAVTYSRDHIKIRFLPLDQVSAGFKMGFIVPTKLGKANKRNRTKRLLREAYRLHQHAFKNGVYSFAPGFHGVLMARTTAIDFSTAETEVVELLQKVQSYMHITFTV